MTAAPAVPHDEVTDWTVVPDRRRLREQLVYIFTEYDPQKLEQVE